MTLPARLVAQVRTKAKAATAYPSALGPVSRQAALRPSSLAASLSSRPAGDAVVSASLFSSLALPLATARCLPRMAGVQLQRNYSTRPTEAEFHVRPKVTLATLRKLYKRQEPITVMTAHDYPTGTLVDKAGIDMTLVGDSLAMVALGYTSTSEVTLEEMLHHCRAVARGTRSSFLVADMPFGTYETNADQAVNNAVRMLKEGKVEAVKLEGGKEMAPTIAQLTKVGIPVLGHIGLTPQRQASLGGYKVQGKSVAKARAMIDDAIALQEAGCYAIVLEAVPAPVATHITNVLSIPTIGIGAGAGCSGQVLVQQDMLGLYGRVPRFCKTYRALADDIVGALKEFSADVKSRAFPADEHTYPMPQEELSRFLQFMSADKVVAEKARIADNQ